MRVVYDAENLVDAHLVKHALESLGIPCFVRGEYLTGAMGELPVQGLLQVCVPDLAWAEADACVKALALSRAEGSAHRDELPDDGLLA
jgi:hypothetical protein